jgi:hypothetical protein
MMKTAPQVPDGAPHTASVLALYEAWVQRWLAQKWRPKLEKRVAELDQKNLTTLGRVHGWITVYEELLNREAQKLAREYLLFARKYNCPDMLSAPRLADFKKQLEDSVRGGIGGLCNRIDIRLAAVGDVSPAAVPKVHHYVQLQGRIQSTIILEMGLLRASAISVPDVPSASQSDSEGICPNRNRARLVRKYRKENGALTMADLGRRVGKSSTAIYGMINGDKRRYNDAALEDFLTKLNLTLAVWNSI